MASLRGRSSARAYWSCPRGGCQSPSPAWRGAGSVCAARPGLGPGLCCDTTSGLTSGRAWSPGSSTTTLTRTAGSRSTVSSSRPAQLTSGHPGCYQVSLSPLPSPLSPLTSHFSPLTAGAAEASVWLDQVWVRPYTSQSAARWEGRISPDCPDLRTEAWREGRNYHVFSSTRDCLLSHHLTVRDLEILNIERSPAGHRHLWLGDLHSTPSLYFTNIFPASCSLLQPPHISSGEGQRYKPTAYQSHYLLHYSPGLTHHQTARRVHDGSPASPPTLRHREGQSENNSTFYHADLLLHTPKTY